MHTERQNFPAPWVRAARTFCLGLAVVQTAALAAAETGLPWLPLSFTAQLLILLAAGLLCGLLWQAGLTLRVNGEGLALRFLPWQWQFRYIRWAEISQLRLLPAGEQPPGAQFGRPARDFTHAYWLSSPELRVLCIELVNNTQLFVSTEKPAELLDFLQHGVSIGRKYAVSR